MPARIVVVHDDPAFMTALGAKFGAEIATFTDPIRALMALEKAASVAFLVTRLQFTSSQPLGLSLARVTRAARPDVRVIFTGKPGHEDYARGLGEFIPEPVDAAHVAIIIEWMDDRAGQ